MFLIPIVIAGAIFASLIIAFWIILFIAALLEKRRVSEYHLIHPEEVPDLPAYFSSMSQEAAIFEFESHGVYSKSTSKIYSWIWLSPCRRIVAAVTTWKICLIRTNVTMVLSKRQNGTFIATVDDAGAFELELSSLVEVEYFVRANFQELLEIHCARLDYEVDQIDLFSESNVAKDLELMEHAINDRLEERGEIRYRDYSRTVWKYTFKGAFRACTRWTKMFRKSMAQSERANRKRPGDSL